jgi:hypothetical protein
LGDANAACERRVDGPHREQSKAGAGNLAGRSCKPIMLGVVLVARNLCGHSVLVSPTQVCALRRVVERGAACKSPIPKSQSDGVLRTTRSGAQLHAGLPQRSSEILSSGPAAGPA